MMKSYTKLILFSVSLLLVNACSMLSTKETGEPKHYFGNAVNQNIAAQVVNPDAPETNTPPEHIGGRLAVGQQRYLSDQVEKPDSLKTSDVKGSGGDE